MPIKYSPVLSTNIGLLQVGWEDKRKLKMIEKIERKEKGMMRSAPA